MTQMSIGEHFGISSQAVGKWLKEVIPPRRILPLCEILEWKVTPHEIDSSIPKPNRWLTKPEASANNHRGYLPMENTAIARKLDPQKSTRLR